MKKRDVIRLPGDPQFISGIYNYCDRWCERCAFTARCLLFSMEQEGPQAQPGGSKNDTFKKQIGGSLKAAQERLNDMTKKPGARIDPEQTEKTSRIDEGQRRNIGRHPIAKAARDYARDVNRWFKNEQPLLLEKEEEIKTKARLGVAGVKEEVAGLTDVVQIIRWYQHQIYVRLLRALRGVQERSLGPAQLPMDYDGSAKVALIAIDRSLTAWTRMKDHFPERADDILNFLVSLDRLRRAVEQEFPDARAFVRPGFDDRL